MDNAACDRLSCSRKEELNYIRRRKMAGTADHCAKQKEPRPDTPDVFAPMWSLEEDGMQVREGLSET